MTYSMDLRERVLAAWTPERSISELSRLFGVERSTIRAWRDRAAAGELASDKPGPKGHTKLTDADVALVLDAVKQEPGVTLRELASRTGVPVAESTIHRLLKKHGISFKKSRSLRPSGNGPT